MVSRQFTILSLLVPVAMIMGTSFTIFVYQHSYKLMILTSYICAFLVVGIFVIIALRPPKKK